MPFVNHCVEQINTAIMNRLNDKRFTSGGVFGLAQLMQREGETIPALVDNSGKGEFTGFDERFSIIIYHRALTILSAETPNRAGFGDGNTSITDTVRMRCVVYADRNRVKMQNVDLASVINASLRTRISRTNQTGMYGANVENITADLDPLSVFITEYQLPATAYNVPTSGAYFAVNYSLNIDYDTSCITDCTTC